MPADPNDTILKRIGLNRDMVRDMVAKARTGSPVPATAVTPTAPELLALMQKIGLDPKPTPSFLVEVPPDLAQAWLHHHNQGNRRPSASKVMRFAAMMRDGVWDTNGETIKFAADGRLLDGQSRLMAIVRADVPVPLEVRFDLEPRHQETMDSGENRKLNHTLQMRGFKNANNLAAALRMLHLYVNGALFASNAGRFNTKRAALYFGNRQALELVAAHPGLQEAVKAATHANLVRLIAPSRLGTLFYIFRRADQDTAARFETQLREGTDLKHGHPVLALRQRLLLALDADDHAALSVNTKVLLVIKAWNALRLGEDVETLRYRKGEPLPPVSGCTLRKQS